MIYTNDDIKQLCLELLEIFNKPSTPKKLGRTVYEAYEIIHQLQRENPLKEEKKL
ncbi:MAG: hypothetical protein LUC30_01170 [Clostridiales bacterium]|nr:hypothetical protein [Clostridiales bacterium]